MKIILFARCETVRADREAEAQHEKEAREAERAAQHMMKEKEKNVNYKRDWLICEENRNYKNCDWKQRFEQKF